MHTTVYFGLNFFIWPRLEPQTILVNLGLSRTEKFSISHQAMGLTGFLKDNFIPRLPKNEDLIPLKVSGDIERKEDGEKDQISVYSRSTSSTAQENPLHRSLKSRHVQLLGISGTIGSALFVAIGKALARGGPLNLLLAFIFWSIPILCITLSTCEFVSYLPITSPFVRMAGRCCDNALEVMAAWNFWFLCCAQIPFEVVTVNSIIHFWRDDYSPAIPLALQVVLYFIINVFGVRIYGETEFWLGLGKIILAVGLIFYSFITMVGGNPQGDVYGFRYWRDPGVMAEYNHTGDLGRFEGFLACLIQACFTFAGPEYVSSVASETVNPRKTLPSAFKQVFYRLTFFFIGGALCVGIIIPYNDPTLVGTMGASKPGAGSSPYVISMQNLGISVLPHIVNGLLVTSAFSAGNSYTYCSSRTLYGFALDGYAPKFLTATTKTGIPMYCVLISLCWALLSFLQLGETASQVLNWITNLITSCQLMNFVVLCVTYVCFFYGLKAQGISRDSLPFKAWYQPYLAIFGGTMSFIMIFVSSYTTFLPGAWTIQSFLFTYLMIFVNIVIFVGFKLIKRTKWKKLHEIDLVSGLREVELHEQAFYASLESKGKLGARPTIWSRISTFIFGSEF